LHGGCCVERAAGVGREHAAHERVAAAVPAEPGAFAFAGVGRDHHLRAAASDLVDLVVVPVAGVGEYDVRTFADAGGVELALGGRDHRFEVAEVGRVDV
jgi:hypothetical protein